MIVRGVILVAATLLVLSPSHARAASGDLDPSFGEGGVAIASFGQPALALTAARQSDGRIVVAGVTAPTKASPTAIAAARFQADGSLDPTFGGDGTVVTEIGPYLDQPARVMVQSDGRIVVVALTEVATAPSAYDLALVRYLADGTLDASFGGDGIVTASLGPGNEIPMAGTLQADDSILVTGVSTSPTVDAFVARFDGAGALDPTFGTAGVVLIDHGGRADRGEAVLVQPDGYIVVAGISFNGTFFGDGTVATLVRLDPLGLLDPAFGSGGKVVYAPAPNALYGALVRQGDGALVVLGAVGENQNLIFSLDRYDSSGALDLMFDGGPTLYGGDKGPDSVAIGPAGEFVVLGGGFSATRLGSDGTIDDAFGIGGNMELRKASLDADVAAIVEPSGDIVLAGSALVGAETPMSAFAVVRLAGTSASCVTDNDCPVCEHCAVGNTCRMGYRSGCTPAASGDATMKIFRNPIAVKRKFEFRWKGDVPAFDPTVADDVTACVYRGNDRVVKVVAPAAGVCSGVDCWLARLDSRYVYSDREQTPDGVRTAKATKESFKWKAGGDLLGETVHEVPPVHTLNPPADPVRLQVHTGSGACLEAVFDTNRTIRGRTFIGKSD